MDEEVIHCFDIFGKEAHGLLPHFLKGWFPQTARGLTPAVCFNHAPVYLTGTNSYLIRFVIAAGC
jgi:hypothetical protein